MDTLQMLLGEMFGMNNKAESQRAKADPVKHKLTRVMEKPLSYRYYPQKVTRSGQKVWWCWSCHRNVAGYFLGWREVRTGKFVKRDRWIASKTRLRLKERAKRKAEKPW